MRRSSFTIFRRNWLQTGGEISDQDLQLLQDGLSQFIREKPDDPDIINREAGICRYIRPNVTITFGPPTDDDRKKSIELVLSYVPRTIRVSDLVLARNRTKVYNKVRDELKRIALRKSLTNSSDGERTSTFITGQNSEQTTKRASSTSTKSLMSSKSTTDDPGDSDSAHPALNCTT